MSAYSSSRFAYEGTETTETSITRVGGATDPTGQAQSRKIVTTANSQWLRPFKAEPYAIWNPTSGANVDIAVYGVVNAGALPLNDELWLEVEYLGSSASPLGTIVSTTKANVLAAGSAVASDSSTWNGTPHTTLDGVPSGGIVMSNGNLTVTHGTTGNGTGVSGTSFLNGGKYYFEVTATLQNLGDGAGLIISGGSFFNMLGGIIGTPFALIYGTAGCTIYSNGAATGKTLAGAVNGDVFGFAVDLTNRLGWVRKNNGNWNGDAAANPATGVGGVTIAAGAFAPAIAFTNSSASNNQTANFGQSSFANAAPSGFLSWDTGWTSFKLTATLSSPQPGQAGVIEARVRAAKPGVTYYIDPQISLTPAGGGSLNTLTANKSSRYAFEGTETTETSITRVGGASDPTGQAQSRKIVTTANSQWLRPFKAEPYAIWNPTTGANVTVTVCGTINAGALPNNDDIWLEVEYLGSSSSPLGTIVTTTKANVLAANAVVASDGSSWNNAVPTNIVFDLASAVNATLSNGNLTVTHSNTSGNSGAQVLSAQSSGKWYFEVTQATTGHGALDAIAALIPAGSGFGGFVITGPTIGVSVFRGGAINANNASTGINIGAFSAGDVCGVAVDFNAGLFWSRKNAGSWNNSGTANPATGVGGVSINLPASLAPTVGFTGTSTAAGDSYTANFGATAYANAAPSGFNNWIAWTPFKLTATLSAPQPGLAGYLEARVRAAKPSTTFYLDPRPVLS